MITWDWSYYWPNFTERYVLPATMLNECQIYLGDGGRRPSPRYIGNQDGCSILTILRKKKETVNNTGENTHKSLN